MKSFFKKLAFVMALAMVVTLAAPAAQSALAATEFTYAEQVSGAKVTTLNLKAGDTEDLKFMGVKDYKNYTLEWKSSNEAVATVDKNGVITAVADGMANIYLQVGDGVDYISTPVAVTVGDAMIVALGTAKDATFTEYALELGTTVDLNFYGVTDWATGKYTCNWVSSDPSVATVDAKGVITPVAEGTTTVTISIVDKATGVALTVTPVVVTVPTAEASTNFTAVQTSDAVATLTFEDTSVTKAALESGLAFYYYINDVKIAYPVQVSKVEDGVATITSYVSFTDGTVYGFEYAGESAEFTASIGAVTTVQASWKSLDDQYRAYVGETTEVSYKLLNAQGVDITAAALARSGAGVNFSFIRESENGDFWFSDITAGTVYFNTLGAVAQVRVDYITGEYDDNYEAIAGPYAIATIASSTAPAYGMNAAAGITGTLVKNTSAAGSAIDWSKASTVIALGDDNSASYQLVAKMKDTRNADIYTDTANQALAETFTFASTNNSILYVDPNGTVMTNSAGTVNVLIYYNTTNASGNRVSTVVGVVTVQVRAARAVATMTVDKSNATISTSTGYNSTTFTINLKDQLGDAIDGNVTVARNNSTLPPSIDAQPGISVVSNPETGKYEVTITADTDNKNLPDGATAYTYTYVVTCGNFTRNFTVTIKAPIKDAQGNNVVSGYRVEFGGDSDLKTTNDAAKAATATLYILSNGVKVDTQTMEYRPDNTASMVVGNYYYRVTKGGTDLGSLTGDGTATITIPLTSLDTTTLTGTATGTSLDVVNKGNKGTGTYTVVVYRAVGSTVATGVAPVSTTTLTVTDSQDTMAYAGKFTNFFDTTAGATDLVSLVESCFRFTNGGTTLDGTDDYTGYYLVVNANYRGTADALTAGTICYVNSVDFYYKVGDTTYVKYTVTVNDYVEVR